jgi:hypothetical protein
MTQQLIALLEDEDGTSFVEFSLFVGFLFLAGAGFLYFSANQFKDAFMGAPGRSY